MDIISKDSFTLFLLIFGTIMFIAGLTSNTVGRFRGWFVAVMGLGVIGTGLYLG